MADTVANIEARVRVLIDDLDPSDYAINQMRMWNIMSREMLEIASKVGVGQSWISPAFTTTDGVSDYTLPTTADYAQVIELKNVTRGWVLSKTDLPTLELQRQTGSTVFVKGIPWWYALRESIPSGVTTDTVHPINVRLYPQPNDAYIIDALVSTVPARLAAAADVVPLPRDLITALEFRTAARCAQIAFNARLNSSLATGAAGNISRYAWRVIGQANAQSIADWTADAQSLIKEGIRRTNQIKRAAQLARVGG